MVKWGTNKWDAITQHLERLTIIFTCARRKNNKIRKKCFTTRKKSCRLPPTHLQLDVTGYCMQLKWSYVQLHLNFKWFLVTSLIMVQLVFLSSFKMDDFYILICANMLSYIQYHIYIWLYKYVTKKLELQNSIWFSLFKPNNDSLHFRRTYLAHFKTNLSNFCGFECVKCRTKKYLGG